MKIGIIGCGAIGAILGKAAEELDEVTHISIFDKSHVCSRTMASKLSKVEPSLTIEDLVDRSDLIIEAASQEALKQFATQILESGKDLMIMSVGALVDDDFRNELGSIAKKKGCKIYVPTGAVCGIDGIKSGSVEDIEEIQLITQKPPTAFKNEAYIIEKGIDLDVVTSPLVLFEGSAREAVKIFPRNINVAATVSLAGIGFERTKVKIIADPGINENSHTIVATGKFGTMKAQVKNFPSERNPKTSMLAALSAVSVLKRLVGDWWIGA
jgi:aspartate dehydrogenase